MSVQYSSSVKLYAYLSEDFGLQLAMKKLGMTEAQLEEKLGRYSRGKRKGKIKGKLTWCRVQQGGWVRMGAYDHDGGQGNGFVCPFVGLTYAYEIEDAFSGLSLLKFFECERMDLAEKTMEKRKEIQAFKESQKQSG